MKRYYALTAVLGAILCLVSCEENAKGPAVDTSFDETVLNITKPASAGQGYSFEISASDAVTWTAEVTDGSFITLAGTSGKGTTRLEYSLTENTGTSSRKGVVTVTASCPEVPSFSASKTVNITQMGSEPYLEIDPSGSAGYGFAAASFSITVSTNQAWTASAGEADWISLSQASGEGSGTIQVSISENSGDSERVAHISVVSEKSGQSASLDVTQQGKGAVYRIVILGYIGKITAGAAKMSITKGASNDELDVTVSEADGATVIEYQKALAEGVWTINSVGGTSLGCLLTIGAGGAISSVESYNPAFGCFGGDSEQRPISISSEADLMKLVAAVDDSVLFCGKFFLQTANITLTSANWPGIGSSNKMFGGVYDGGNKKIEGLAIIDENTSITDNPALGRGLFNHVKGSSAGFAAIKNLSVYGSIEAKVGHVGGIVAHAADSTLIDNCSSNVTVNAACVYTANGGANVGGIMGWGGGKGTTISNCTNHGTVYCGTGIAAEGTLANNVGGVIGGISGNADEPSTVVNCSNRASVNVHGNGGGVVGNIGSAVTLERLSNYGDVTSTCTNGRIGGVAGNLGAANVSLSESFNKGKVSGIKANLGGLVGYAIGASVSNCYNSGDVALSSGNNANNGGIVGHKADANAKIEYCYNCGAFIIGDDKTNFGAIAGTNAAADVIASNVKGCYYESGKGAVKGLAKNNEDIATVAEGKTADEMKAGAFPEWSTTIWSFSSGHYPTLKNNPEN